MKKHRPALVLATAFVLAIGGVALAGCAAPQSDNDEVLAKLDRMQAQIDELEAGQQGSSASDPSQGAASDASAGNSASTAVSDASSVDEFSAALGDLAARADEAAATAGAVAVPANAADRPQAYFDAKAPLQELDRELDSIDDAIEAAYRQGSITREDVWALEQQEDAIDAVLDRAEDDLEMRMGVDD